jgi:hypothetical protein
MAIDVFQFDGNIESKILGGCRCGQKWDGQAKNKRTRHCRFAILFHRFHAFPPEWSNPCHSCLPVTMSTFVEIVIPLKVRSCSNPDTISFFVAIIIVPPGLGSFRYTPVTINGRVFKVIGLNTALVLSGVDGFPAISSPAWNGIQSNINKNIILGPQRIIMLSLLITY